MSRATLPVRAGIYGFTQEELAEIAAADIAIDREESDRQRELYWKKKKKKAAGAVGERV